MDAKNTTISGDTPHLSSLFSSSPTTASPDQTTNKWQSSKTSV